MFVARIETMLSGFLVHYYRAIPFHIGEGALECHLPITFSQNKGFCSGKSEKKFNCSSCTFSNLIFYRIKRVPVTGSSGIPTQGAKYLETKLYILPLLSVHMFVSEPFSVSITPFTFPVRSLSCRAFVSRLRLSSSGLQLEIINRFFFKRNNMSRAMRTCVWCHLRTTKAQISLRIRAVWSAPLLFAA